MSRFSMTVIPGKIPRPSGAWLIPRTTRRSARRALMSSPSKVIEPDDSGRSPDTTRIVVVFPAPFAPIRVTTSPSFTVSEISCRAWMRP